MVLLDQIVEIFDLPQLHAFRKYPGGFELSNRFGIGRVLVDIDHTRCWRGGVGGCRSRGLFHLLLDQTRPRNWTSKGAQRVEEETFGGLGITSRTEQKL